MRPCKSQEGDQISYLRVHNYEDVLLRFHFFPLTGKVPGVPRYGLLLFLGVLLSALECFCACLLLKDLSHLFCLFIKEFWWEGRCYVGKIFSGSVYPCYMESHR